MKIIQALKLVKELNEKAADLRAKIANNSALLSIETPMYPNQEAQVASWLQAHEDIVREISRLRYQIARTNLMTEVDIELDGKVVRKSITEWIVRRKEGATLDATAWKGLTDRNLKEQNLQPNPQGPITEIRIRRFYDPVKRDQKIALYVSEPTKIDATLEVVNAMTDLLA